MSCLALGLASPQASAQAVKLVSNSSTMVDASGAIVGPSGTFQFTTAQEFTTGSHPTGYSLSAVIIDGGSQNSLTTLLVSIYTESSGVPGSEIATLSGGTSVTAGLTNTFTAPQGTILAAQTKYFVFMEGRRTRVALVQTSEGGEDTDSADGWTIADSRLFRNADAAAWSTENLALRLTVRGAPRVETTPTITDIEILSTPSLCDGRAYAQSEEVRIGVTFSEAVSVDATGGEPYLSLRMNDYDAPAAYKEGSGTTQLVFAKEIANTDFSGHGMSFAVDDPDVHSARGLQLDGGTIRSTADGTNAVLTGTTLARIDNAHMIGSVMTGATLTSRPATGDTYGKGEQLRVTLEFNETFMTSGITNTTRLSLVLDSGTVAANFRQFTGTKMHFGYTIADGDTDANGLGVAKDALSLGGLNTNGYVPCNDAIEALSTDKVDAVGPTLLTSAPNGPQTSVDGTKVVLTFDEPVSMTTADTGAFTVTVDGTDRGVDTVIAQGTQVVLMLVSPAATGETVTVSYTDPTSNDDTGAIQDKLSNDAPSFSNQAVTNKVPTSGTPGKPTGVTATPTPTTVTVSWTAPSDPGTTAVTGYAVEWATNENGPWSTATADTGSTTTSYTHTGRTPQTSYHYRVGAINDSGTGERSDSASATTPAAPVVTITVGPIGNPTTSIGEDAASLTFVLSRDGDTSERLQVKLRVTLKGEFLSVSQIFGQTDIEAGAANKNWPLLPTNDNVDEPDGSVTVELLPGTGYTLGTATSATVTILDDDEPPGAPTLTVTPGNAQAALAWTAPSDTGSETITGYEYRVSPDATVTWDPDWTAILDSAPGETNAASYTVSTGLANGTAYTFELHAINAIGASPPSARITVTPSTTVNNAPAFPATETGMRNVVENTAAETAIGAAVAATDPDPGDTVSYTLGGPDASHFTIVSTSGQLKVGSSAFDYEAPVDADGNNRYQVTVTAADGNGASAVLPVTVEVTGAASVESVAITSIPADYHSSGVIYGEPDLAQRRALDARAGHGVRRRGRPARGRQRQRGRARDRVQADGAFLSVGPPHDAGGRWRHSRRRAARRPRRGSAGGGVVLARPGVLRGRLGR